MWAKRMCTPSLCNKGGNSRQMMSALLILEPRPDTDSGSPQRFSSWIFSKVLSADSVLLRMDVLREW